MTDDQKKKQLRGLARWRSNGRFSKIHQKVKLHMKNYGLKGFLSEEYFHGFWIDEYYPKYKVAVEINGDYWHANPKFYSADYYNNRIKLTAAQIWEKDNCRINALKKFGIKVFLIWEYQIKDKKLLNKKMKEIETWIKHT